MNEADKANAWDEVTLGLGSQGERAADLASRLVREHRAATALVGALRASVESVDLASVPVLTNIEVREMLEVFDKAAAGPAPKAE